jgi:hypothetical protein
VVSPSDATEVEVLPPSEPPPQALIRAAKLSEQATKTSLFLLGFERGFKLGIKLVSKVFGINIDILNPSYRVVLKKV